VGSSNLIPEVSKTLMVTDPRLKSGILYPNFDYIKSLGINAVLAQPTIVHQTTTMVTHVSDYRNIMKDFGTMADFDALLADA